MSRARRSSFRLRLVLQTMGVAGAVVTAFGAGAWWYAGDQQARNHDLRIAQESRRLWKQLTPRSDADEIAAATAETFQGADAPVAVTVVWHADDHPAAAVAGPAWNEANRDRFLRRLPVGPDVVTRAVDAGSSRQARARSPETAATGALRRPLMHEIRPPAFFTIRDGASDWRFGAFSNPHYTVFVGLSEGDLRAAARRSALGFAAAGLGALLLAGAGAWWTSGRAIRPLRRIAATAGRMSAGNLDERIPLGDGDDREIAQLIAALNDMTARLQAGFAQASRFTADASHELRTPLAVMQNTLNEAIRAPSLDDATRERLGVVLHQTSRLKSLTHSLLLLSQADAGELPVRKECYDLSRDLGDLMEDAESLCEQAGFTFDPRIEPGVTVEADRGLMHQVFQNLVSNAVKHNRPGGRVEVRLSNGDRGARFEIVNTSDPRDVDAGRKLFDRFYRADASRHGDGFGLGLDIARELARANGATLELLETPAGLTGFAVGFGG